MAQSQHLLPRHFYLPSGGPAWGRLKALFDRSPCCEKDNVSRHAWAAILRTYFLDYDPAQLQPGQVLSDESAFYDVTVQPHCETPVKLDWRTRPDIVTVQSIQTTQRGGKVEQFNRDLIWVVCKPPEIDQPNEWSLVMDEATDRLHVAHPTTSLWLILNIGLKWLIFYWDPANPANPAAAGQNLRIINAADTETGDVDPRIRRPPGIDSGNIDQNNVVNVTQAKSLDCFSLTHQGGGPPVLAYQDDLDFLENCITVMRNHQGYVGRNNPEFP